MFPHNRIPRSLLAGQGVLWFHHLAVTLLVSMLCFRFVLQKILSPHRAVSPKRTLLRLILRLALCIASLTSARAQVPVLLSLKATATNATISVTGDSGTSLQVQFSTNLPAGPWTTLTNITLGAAPSQVTDPVAPAAMRYYRGLVGAATNIVWILPGTFFMGSPTNELERSTNELRHSVTITKGFYISKYQVSQTNYISVMSNNPSYYTSAHGYTNDLNRPVEQVTWLDATNYCFLLTQRERLAGRIATNWSYRLPTEAEWEFACRAGTTNAFYFGTNLTSGLVNFNGEYEYYSGTGTVFNASGIFLNRTVAVGGYQPNDSGLYDMAGNVWEWCSDWFGNYPAGSVSDPTGPATGSARVFRGGSLNATGKLCRSANRNSASPTISVNTIGFRVVLSGP